MLNKFTFAFALLFAVQVQTISLHSANKSAGRIADDASEPAKDGLEVVVGETYANETTAEANVVHATTYNTAGEKIDDAATA